jgi:F0F1-type ATP synthase gamma subunit
LIADFSSEFSDNVEVLFTKPISRLVSEKFLSGEYSKVVVFYSHYVNTIKQIPLSREFFPLTKASIDNYFKQIF